VSDLQYYNAERHIKGYIEYAFLDMFKIMEADQTLEGFVKKWEVMYFKTFSEIENSEHEGSFINKTALRFHCQNKAMHRVLMGICDELGSAN